MYSEKTLSSLSMLADYLPRSPPGIGNKYLTGVLNNNNFQGHIDPQVRCLSEASGRSKKHALSFPEGSVQEGRSHFCAQSVLPVREYGKMARTPLAAFFNSPLHHSGKCQPIHRA